MKDKKSKIYGFLKEFFRLPKFKIILVTILLLILMLSGCEKLSQEPTFRYVEPLDKSCDFDSIEECNSNPNCVVKGLDDYIREGMAEDFTCCPKNKTDTSQIVNYSLEKDPCSWIPG